MDSDVRNSLIGLVLVLWLTIGPVVASCEYRAYYEADLKYKTVDRICITVEKCFGK